LLRGEAENAGWIAPDYESHPGVAQIADPVEQDQWRLRQGYHRLEPLAKLSSAQTSANCRLPIRENVACGILFGDV
jgi:hypothetical protein